MEANNLTDTNFYDGIVTRLKQEAKILNERLVKIRSNQNSNTMNDYISTLKSLRETLDLISRYDWKTHYSEYKTQHGAFSEEIKQVAVWEQNHDAQTRNHKIWNVIERVK